MENIPLKNLVLCSFNSDEENHIAFLKYLLDDESIKKRFQGLLPNLLSTSSDIIGKGFFLMFEQKLIGYIEISNFNELEESVYLRAAIAKEYRDQGFGNMMLLECSNYIFETFRYVKHIKLVIAKDNKSCLNIANECGYIWEYKDIFVKDAITEILNK